MAIDKSTKLADAVLAILDVILPEDKTFHAEPYQNGRESGWAMYADSTMTKIAFAEYRNSDELVIYTGEFAEFGMQGNPPSEAVYKAKLFWDRDNLYDAAEFIKSYLIS